MLLIASTSKPAKLDKIIRPILQGSGVQAMVIQPDDLYNENIVEGNDHIQLLMGASGFDVLVQAGLTKKKQKVGSSRERLYQVQGRYSLVTYDVGITEFLPELIPDIQWDVRLAVRLALTGSLDPVVGDYKYVPNFCEVMEWAHSLDKEEIHPITLDLETLGLDEFSATARIITIQISYQEKFSHVYQVHYTGKVDSLVWEQLNELFQMPWLNFVGANLKYDLRWLWKQCGLEIKNHKFDTQLVGGLVNENRYNSLKAHCKEYASDLGGYETKFEDKWDKARMDLALAGDPKGFLQYAGGDTDAALRIYKPLRKEILKDPILARFYTRLLHPASIAFRKLESRGILIDEARYKTLHVEAVVERDSLSKACFDMISNHIKYRYADNLKLTRDVIIVDFLFGPHGLNLKPKMMTPSGEAPSTAWAHLKEFIDHPKAGPFVKALKQYNATCKTIDTYIVGFLAHLRSDGRFHPSYILAKGGQSGDEDEGGGTNTGRSSCKDPAYQTWPKRTAWAKRLRTVVIVPEGYVIVKLDFSQGELKLMADAANCKAMIEAYSKGQDLHALTAAQFLNMTIEQFLKLPDDEIEKHRYGAKAGNFGLIYRISPEGYQAFAETSYGVKLSLAQAEKNHKAFFELYPEVRTYHESQVKHAQKYGWVRNPLGRVRHLPLINSFDGKTRGKQERQAINAPGQGALFDMMMLLMVQIDRVRPDVWMFGNTHDSLEMYLKADTWKEDCLQIKQMAENLPFHEFDWKPKVKFTVDFEVGFKTLGEMDKMALKDGMWVDKKGNPF